MNDWNTTLQQDGIDDTAHALEGMYKAAEYCHGRPVDLRLRHGFYRLIDSNGTTAFGAKTLHGLAATVRMRELQLRQADADEASDEATAHAASAI